MVMVGVVCDEQNEADEVDRMKFVMQVSLDVAVVFPVGRNGYISSCRSI